MSSCGAMRMLPRVYRFSGRFGPLEERSFRLVWLARTTSAFGTGLVPVALAFALLQDLDASSSDLGLVLASFAGSRVVFTLAGGVWGDRLDRRRVVVTCDLLAAAVNLVIFVLLVTGRMSVLGFAVSAAAFGASSAFFGPASTGLVAASVSRPRLQQANALIGMSVAVADIVGPALAGILVAVVGAEWAFALEGLSFLASAGFMLALRIAPGAAAVRQTFLADLAAGWRAVTSRSWLWPCLIVFSLSNVANAAFFVLGPVVFQQELGGASEWGLALSLAGLGGLVGGAVALRLRPQRPLLVAFGIWIALALPLLALVPPLPALAVGVAAAVSFAVGLLGNAIWEATLQRHVPDDVLSRVSSYDWLVSLIFTPLGFALAGPTADAIGLDATLLAAATLLVVVHAAVLLVPSVRNLRDVPAGQPAELPAAP
jgi:predicted MFS family arabinose efflux permease